MSSSITRVRGCTALLWVVLNRINRSGRRQGELSSTAFSVLRLLYMSKQGKTRMQDLAKLNGVSKSTVTDYFDNLEAKGYVQRLKDESDLRVNYVCLTDKGESLVEENERKIMQYLESCAASLTDEEMEIFARLFSKFMGGVGTVPFQTLFEAAMNRKFD